MSVNDLASSQVAKRYSDYKTPVLVVLALHIVGFGILFLFIMPGQVRVGNQLFGTGLAITAYLFGVRHAFDPDHIAAIDNTTRTLQKKGRRPKTVGMWFSLGHASVVFTLTALVAYGAHLASTLMDDKSTIHRELGIAGTSISGTFLILLGTINLVALAGILKALRALRTGTYSEDALTEILDKRGLFARFLAPVLKRIGKPWHIFPIGFLFGLGFDTATEVALLVLAGTGAVTGAPWYAIVTLPVLFGAGMTLMDTVDGMFMGAAYDWAFSKPARKIFYNLTITALSVAIALFIGVVELVQVLSSDFEWHGPLIDWIAGIPINHFGYIVVGMFLVTWICALAIWKFGRLDSRWDIPQPQHAAQ